MLMLAANGCHRFTFTEFQLSIQRCLRLLDAKSIQRWHRLRWLLWSVVLQLTLRTKLSIAGCIWLSDCTIIMVSIPWVVLNESILVNRAAFWAWRRCCMLLPCEDRVLRSLQVILWCLKVILGCLEVISGGLLTAGLMIKWVSLRLRVD